MTSRHPAKKPSGGRPNIRKLLSKESLTSLASFTRQESSSDGQSSAPVSRNPSRKATQNSVAASLGVILEKTSGPWLERDVVSSPRLGQQELNLNDEKKQSREGSSVKLVRSYDATSPTSDNTTSPTNPDVDRASTESPQPTPSPRWQNLRHHILPEAQITTSPNPSFTSFSQLNLSSASPASHSQPLPQKSRLATRFGFRQVVAETRLAADETTRRFADEIQRTCYEIRLADSRNAKPEREASQPNTIGSTLHLPFMSSASLPLSNSNALNSATQSTFKSALRGAPSTATLTNQSGNRLYALTTLQGIIMRYAAVQDSVVSRLLPHELEVLSVLLVPFLRQSIEPVVEDERRISLQIFESLLSIWKTSADVVIQRCIWCCKAAAMPRSPLRLRILYLLKGMLTFPEGPLDSLSALTTVVSNLVILADYFEGHSSSSISSHNSGTGELPAVMELIEAIVEGKIGQLDTEELERKHNTIALSSDTVDDLRTGVCVEAIVNCSEFGSSDQRATMLRFAEKLWPSFDASKPATPLRTKVHLDKISAFARSALSILHDAIGTSQILTFTDSRRILSLLCNRALPELAHLRAGAESIVTAIRSSSIRVVLLLLTFEATHEEDDDNDDEDTFADPKQSQSRELLLRWIGDAQWKETVEVEVKNIPTSFDWSTSPIIAYNLLFSLPEDIRRRVAGLMAPSFQERLVADSPPQVSEPLTRLLTVFATMSPQVFYKPLFLCAASAKEETVTRQMATLIALGRHMPNFWTSDDEMLSVALMSDPGSISSSKGKTKEGDKMPWGTPRLGQTMILLEVIASLQNIRKEREGSHVETTSSSMVFSKIVKFATSLETRLAVLIYAKEDSLLVPIPQRILFATLYLEIRLISGSLKSPTWLPQVMNWTLQHSSSSDDFKRSIPAEQMEGIWRAPLQIYNQHGDSFKPTHQRKGTANLLSPQRSTFHEATPDDRQATTQSRCQLLESLSLNPLPSLLKLLVTMSGSLKHDDYVRLSPILWERCLLLQERTALLSACFLCMQCAEKAHDKFVSLVIAHLQSPTPSIRREAVQRLGVLTNWRFQLLSLNFITDRTNRRPFKLARPPLTFVATDVGDSKFIPHNDIEDTTGGKKHALPLDIRRRLMEIGWADEEQAVDEVLEWRRTPMSLLGTTQLDEISGSDVVIDEASGSDHGHSPTPGGSASPSGSPAVRGGMGMVRRNSSQGTHPGKRRPVFVEPLIAVFIPLSKLAMEDDHSVASAAQELVLDFMRDDPAVLCRAAFNVFSDERQSIDKAVTTFRHLMTLRRVLPPRFTHHAFNHLAGYLKFLAKNMESQNALYDFSHTLPLVAKLAPQVSDISIRGIRRAKIEMFMFPSGSLYFTDPAPVGPMFPRGPDNLNPFADCPSDLVHITMIRMSQNLFALDLLKRNPQDAHIVRKTWTPLVLPDVLFYTDDESTLPRRHQTRQILDQSRPTLRLSLSFSRTHLLLVAQLFRCLTRHLNDRAELAVFLEGVNRILLRHRDDVGIVSHAIIAFLIASTRFRRLMSSGTGFTIFLPALMKVYCEAEGDVSVREAIEYAFHRFFAVHEEAFVYQALQVVSNVVSEPGVNGHWVASTTYHLLSMLKSNPSSFDAAGIRDATKAQEEETAMAITADERPQIFLASLREKGRTNAEKLQSSFSLDIFDNKRFQPDNVVRMVLTVIAHDPTIRRAQHFLRLFRYLVPHLYNASASARLVLRDGVDALANIIASKMSKTKEGMLYRPKATTEAAELLSNDAKSQGKNTTNPSAPCDVQVMRSDYLMLFASYVKEGGAHRVTSLQRSLELVKVLLKDAAPSSDATESIKLFMDQLGETFIIRQDVKYTVSLLKDLAPIIKAHGSVIDLSGLFKSLSTLATTPAFANDVKFTEAVVSQVCAAALEVTELAAQENILSSLTYIPSLVSLLSESVCLLGSDVVREIEKRDPSPAFLSGLVLPFIFHLRTTKDLALNTQWTDSSRQDAHAQAWAQLLSYAVSAIGNPTRYDRSGLKARDPMKRSPSFTSPELPAEEEDEVRHSSSLRRPKRRPSGQSSIVASVRLAVAFVTLKAVIYRGEEDISKTFPGAWIHVGGLIRSMLHDGSVAFLFRIDPHSAPPSPIPSPASNKSFDDIQGKSSDHYPFVASSRSFLADPFSDVTPSNSRPGSPTNLHSKKATVSNLPSPRVVDYILWSLLEFVCLRRTPLSVQLRTLMHEKAYSLNEILRERMGFNGHLFGSARRRGERPGTIYSKPRMKPPSPSSTPGASPRLGPTEPMLFPSGTSSSISTLHAHASLDGSPFKSPNAGTRTKPSPGLKLPDVTSQTFLSPAFIPASVSGGSIGSKLQAEQTEEAMDMAVDGRQALRISTIRSPTLIRRTYDRIRNVQRYLGYKNLLLLPRDVIESARQSLDAHENATGTSRSRASMLFEKPRDAEPEPRAWSKAQTAELLLAEAQDILHAWLIESSVKASFAEAKQVDGGSGVADVTTEISYIPS